MSPPRPLTLPELLEAVRGYVAATLPGESAAELRITLASGHRVTHPVPVVPATRQLPPRRHSPDYRSVAWDGQEYSFSPAQASVVRVLWEAWEDALGDVGSDALLAAAGNDEGGGRLRDLFRGHSAWGSLIVPGASRGTFRLAG